MASSHSLTRSVLVVSIVAASLLLLTLRDTSPVPVAGDPETLTSSTTTTQNLPSSSQPANFLEQTTTPNSITPARLAVVGDVGTGSAEELATALGMDKTEGNTEFDALLLLGDNVYPDGDASQLDRTVFSPFAGVLDGGTKLVPVLGNHDVDSGFADEQLVAFGLTSPWYDTMIGDTLIVALDSNDAGNPEQLQWLEETLSSTPATWKIAIMHHPPYSAGQHGSSLNVREAFARVFEANGVQLVLAGHDHDYQRSKPIGGVTYVVSGGGAKLREAGREDFTEVSQSILHFLDIRIDEDGLTLEAVNQAGDIFDSVNLS